MSSDVRRLVTDLDAIRFSLGRDIHLTWEIRSHNPTLTSTKSIDETSPRNHRDESHLRRPSIVVSCCVLPNIDEHLLDGILSISRGSAKSAREGRNETAVASDALVYGGSITSGNALQNRFRHFRQTFRCQARAGALDNPKSHADPIGNQPTLAE
jgi:hypothetical protein